MRERLDLVLHQVFDPIELLLKFRIRLKIPSHASNSSVGPSPEPVCENVVAQK
jgi:hypothetical protein